MKIVLKAIFWDVDGTISDTEMDGHRVAFNQAFKDLGYTWYWDRNLYATLLKIAGGKNRIKRYSIDINESINDEEIKDIHKQKQIIYEGIVETGQLSFKTGVKRLIDELYRANIQQWIVTTSSLKSVNALIDNLYKGARNPFSGYITSDDIRLPKPHPEAYEKAILKSGINPSSAIAIEDSYNGMSSAKKAGLKVLLTPSPWDIKPAHYSIATSVVSQLGDPGKECKIIKGPSEDTKYISLDYLNEMANM